MNAQDIYDELKQDLKEMKATLKELAMATTTLALHSQRLDNVENRVAKMETSHDEVWEAVKEIQSTCRVRERVYNYGLRHMESPSIGFMVTPLNLAYWHSQRKRSEAGRIPAQTQRPIRVLWSGCTR